MNEEQVLFSANTEYDSEQTVVTTSATVIAQDVIPAGIMVKAAGGEHIGPAGDIDNIESSILIARFNVRDFVDD
jgi:hypothetical protein